MTLAASAPLSIKTTSGVNRDIAYEVHRGDTPGSESLWNLGVLAGKTSGGVSMLEFLGYTQPAPTVYVSWEVNGLTGGRLTIIDNALNTRVNVITNTSQSGSFTLLDSPFYLPYTVTGYWQSGSGNTVRFRVCNTVVGAEGTQYTSPDIDIHLVSDSFVVSPTPVSVHIQLTSGNQPLDVCGSGGGPVV